jgi:hypothetical protein
MAIGSKDIETLWKKYSEGANKQGISVAQFFESNGVPYHAFEKWYKKNFTQPSVVDCVVAGSPEAVVDNQETAREPKKRELCISYVNIGLSNGMKIEHHKLSYDDLVCFIQKLQPLCLV